MKANTITGGGNKLYLIEFDPITKEQISYSRSNSNHTHRWRPRGREAISI